MPATSEAALKRKRIRQRERTREWKLRNPEKVREQKARYWQRNKKKVADGKRKWQQANVKKVRVQRARYKRRCRDQSRVEKLGKAYELKELWVVLTDYRKSTEGVRVRDKSPPPTKRQRREKTNPPPPPPRKRQRREKSKIYNYNWYKKLKGDPVRYKEYLERSRERTSERGQRLRGDPVRYKEYRERKTASGRKSRQKIRDDPVRYKEYLRKKRESRQRLKNDAVQYKLFVERERLWKRKSRQRIREDPLRQEAYRKRMIEFDRKRNATKRKKNVKPKEVVVEKPVKTCDDCGLCIPCKGFEIVSWSHYYDHHFLKHKENKNEKVVVEDPDEPDPMLAQPSSSSKHKENDERGYCTEDSDTSVDTALEEELERMLAQPSDKESDKESDEEEEALVDELDHMLTYSSDNESDVMVQHLKRVKTHHRRGADKIFEQWQDNEEMEGIVHELETEMDGLNSAHYEVARTYQQFEREDQVERSRDDYHRSIEVTQELMDELEQFLSN